jgi:hypothetical protein
MVKPMNRPLWQTPLLPAFLVLLAGLTFGYCRGFGMFLLASVVVVILLPITVYYIGFAIVQKQPNRWRDTAIAIVAVAVAPLLAYVISHFHNEIRFIAWAPLHGRLLSQYAGKDGIITGWDSWGIAGSENDSYLAVDVSDSISSSIAAASWRSRLGTIVRISRHRAGVKAALHRDNL